jgi:hypothetical protein
VFIVHDSIKLIEHTLTIVGEDDLRVANEDEVYDACIRWLNHSFEQRKTDFHLVITLTTIDMYSNIYDFLDTSTCSTSISQSSNEQRST